MQKQFTIALFIAVLFAPALGQSDGSAGGLFAQTLKGTIQNPQGSGLPFVSVGLLNHDSSVAKATVTNEQGQFVFEKVKAGYCLLTATAIGYHIRKVRI